MGLIVKNNIIISGTQIELPEVYGRIEFAGRANGKTLEISLATYASLDAYKNGASALTSADRIIATNKNWVITG